MAFTYKPHEESEEVKQRAAKAAEYETPYQRSAETQARYDAAADNYALKPGEYVDAYADLIKGTREKYVNRDPFSYDVTSDALYQQYKDQYINGGRRAMADTMGQAAALTGGYGNSYAATAGNQAYQSYLQKLNDVVPQLYSMAYQRYQDEGNELKDLLNIYENAEAKEYSRYGDNFNRWFTEQQYFDNLAANAESNDMTRFYTDRDYYTNLANTARQWDYGQYTDAWTRALQEYTQQVSEDQWNKTYELQKKSASRSGGGSSSSKGTSRSDYSGVLKDFNSATNADEAYGILNDAVRNDFISQDDMDSIWQRSKWYSQGSGYTPGSSTAYNAYSSGTSGGGGGGRRTMMTR